MIECAKQQIPMTRFHILPYLIFILLCVAVLPAHSERFLVDQSLPSARSLGPSDLGVIINDADPLSATLGAYYVAKRKIPDRNVIHVSFPPDRRVMTKDMFAEIKQDVDQRTPYFVQAFALTWMKPYRVECMSITTAFAMGFDDAFCSKGCQPTKQSPYFNSLSHRPWSDHGIRPTMSIAANSLAEGVALIKRGVAADYSYPFGMGYLVSTSDRNRNVRSDFYEGIMQNLAPLFSMQIVEQDSIQNKDDVFFYFTGLTKVPHLETLKFLPGAVADHLTSAGGVLDGMGQMSALRWLEAGATGSYGAVVEPCNYPQKFPHPHILMQHYLNGDSLIEAYWKSVTWPGQGIFIGEPLATPFARPPELH